MVTKSKYYSTVNSIIKYLVFFLIISFTSIFPGEYKLTQNQDQLKILSLNDCLSIALENNHKIKAIKHGIQISETKKKQAESGYWPQVSVKALYSLFDQSPIFSIPEFQLNVPPISIFGPPISLPTIDIPRQDIKLMDNQNINALLEISFPIYTGGRLDALNRQAEHGVEISKLEHRKSNLEIIYEVTRYYYSVLLARKIYNISSDALERLEVTLKLTQSTYENGSGKVTKLDYLKNKILVEQVRIVVTEMKKNVALSKDALAFALGTGNNFDIPDEELPFVNDNILIEDIDEPLFHNNPDWLKINSALLIYQAKIDEAYSDYLPKIGITGSFNQNINSYRNGITNKINNQLWMISLGTEIPLFNGFRTSNEVSEAKIRLRKTEEEKLLFQDAVILQIKELLKKIEIAAENVSNTFQAKISASENRSLNERAFEQDLAEAKDLIEAQIMESIMEIQYQKALFEYNDAKAYLNFITGKE